MQTPQRPAVLAVDFTAGQVLRAANVTNPTLQTWIRRGLVVGEGEGVDMPGKPGVRRAFGFRTVMEIAIAAALTNIGLGAAQAFRAALHFAHTGDKEREVAFPFPSGRTLICVAGDRSTIVQWTEGEDVMSLARARLQRPLGFVILDASAVFDRVTASLGHHPEAMLEAAYGARQ